MSRLEERELPAHTAEQLATWQTELNAIADYHERVQSAPRAFRQRSSTVTLSSVRQELAHMSGGLERCGYCEDSLGHQVDHIWPKSWYPELTFVWHNFLFSCGVCNSLKGARFAIVCSDMLHELVRQRGSRRTPPPSGSSAIIDPRREDPLDYLEIDLTGTFAVRPQFGIDGLARLRADYTIDLLGLNDRDALISARRQACRSYSLRTREYASLDPDTPVTTRQRLLTELGGLHHRMVWEEMKRSPDLVDGLRRDFDAAPELRMI